LDAVIEARRSYWTSHPLCRALRDRTRIGVGMTEGTEFKLVTFERTSARDMLQKLRREIERLESAADRAFVRDHVVNAFWTAWHLHEWVWDAIRERPELKDVTLKYRGIDEAGIDDQRAFGVALARRFVPLKICWLIATSPKLIQVVLPSESDARAVMPAVSGIDGSREMQVFSTAASASTRCIPMIIIVGKPVVATRILKEIEDYWITLIHECGIEQLQ